MLGATAARRRSPPALAPRAPAAQPAATVAGVQAAAASRSPSWSAQAIREALAATGGNKLAASRLLGISRATLYEKLWKTADLKVRQLSEFQTIAKLS